MVEAVYDEGAIGKPSQGVVIGQKPDAVVGEFGVGYVPPDADNPDDVAVFVAERPLRCRNPPFRARGGFYIVVESRNVSTTAKNFLFNVVEGLRALARMNIEIRKTDQVLWMRETAIGGERFVGGDEAAVGVLCPQIVWD